MKDRLGIRPPVPLIDEPPEEYHQAHRRMGEWLDGRCLVCYPYPEPAPGQAELPWVETQPLSRAVEGESRGETNEREGP